MKTLDPRAGNPDSDPFSISSSLLISLLVKVHLQRKTLREETLIKHMQPNPEKGGGLPSQIRKK